jgi:hypothetical protein
MRNSGQRTRHGGGVMRTTVMWLAGAAVGGRTIGDAMREGPGRAAWGNGRMHLLFADTWKKWRCPSTLLRSHPIDLPSTSDVRRREDRAPALDFSLSNRHPATFPPRRPRPRPSGDSRTVQIGCLCESNQFCSSAVLVDRSTYLISSG